MALAIARGASRRTAAQAAGVSVSTVQRRLQDCGFRQRVKELRNELLERSVGVLIAASLTAARTMKTICESGQNEFVRLAAARSILELSGLTKRTIENEQMQVRLESLEQILKRR